MKQFCRMVGGRLSAALWLLAFLIVPLPALAADPIRHFRLANGLEAVLVPGKGNGIAVHMVWYRIGAADETKGKTGLAHYLEHMMFRRLEDEAGKAHGEDFSSQLARLGGRSNAWTSHDATVYHQTLPAQHLEAVMVLEAARMASFDAPLAAAQAELDVVLEERRLRRARSPERAFYQQMRANLFGDDHPYGRPVIGWLDDIESLSLDDLRSFHAMHYHPSRAVVVVGGDIKLDEAEAAIRRHYGAVGGRSHAKETIAKETIAKETIPDRQTPVRQAKLVQHDAQVKRPALYRFYLVPRAETGLGEAIDKTAARDLMLELFGGSAAARLHRELVLEQQIATSAYVWQEEAIAGPGLIGISLAPAPGIAPEKAEAALDRLIKQLQEAGVSAKEMQRGKRRIKASEIFARDDSFGLAQAFAALAADGFDIDYFDNWLAAIEQSSADEVQAAARHWLDEKRAITGLLLPADEKP